MFQSTWWSRCLQGLILVALTAGVIAHASSQVVQHGFAFDLRYDNQDAELLDYAYGDSKLPVRPPEWALKEGRTFFFNSVSGEMLRGEFLYVKWRILNTGQIYEDKVDLRHRLPADIREHRITFLIRGPQLHVYLVTPERRPSDVPPIGPGRYR